MSLGWQGTPPSGEDVIHDLLAQLSAARPNDILWVAAAGNDQSAGGQLFICTCSADARLPQMPDHTLGQVESIIYPPA